MLLIKANDPNATAKKVLAAHQRNFGITELKARLDDIKEEADELINHTSEENLREELSDLLGTCYALAAEKDWLIDDLIKENIDKMVSRFNSGYYTKKE